MKNKTIKISFSLKELREVYRALNVCLLDEDYIKDDTLNKIIFKIWSKNKKTILNLKDCNYETK